MSLPFDPARSQGLTLIRIVLALLLFVHGATRLGLGTVDDFGVFLEGRGIPLGVGVAWFVTLFELSAAPILAWGRAVAPIALVFATIYACGLWLVHWSQGWFVVGAGRGGMEYSVLILACLFGLAWAHRPRGTKSG
ncbi:MAG: DoxX family protein [Pseudomonadota bacterium]